MPVDTCSRAETLPQARSATAAIAAACLRTNRAPARRPANPGERVLHRGDHDAAVDGFLASHRIGDLQQRYGDSHPRLLQARSEQGQISGRIAAEVNKIIRSKEMEERLRGDGVTAAGGTPEALHEQIRREIPMWRGVVKAAGMEGQ